MMSAGILTILPILLLILIIVGLVVVNKQFTHKPLTFQKSKRILIGYISILLLATIFSFLLPKSEAKIIDKNDLNEHWKNGLYHRALLGEFSSIDKEYVEQSWDLPYTSDSLTLDADFYDEAILIEKTGELDNKIEVYFVKDWDILGINSVNLDISEYTPDMEVDLKSNTLRFVSLEEGQRVKIAYNDLPFTMKQLNGDGQYGSAGYGASRSRFFYIRVPEDIEVQVPEFMYVNYVEN